VPKYGKHPISNRWD